MVAHYILLIFYEHLHITHKTQRLCSVVVPSRTHNWEIVGWIHPDAMAVHCYQTLMSGIHAHRLALTDMSVSATVCNAHFPPI